MKSVMRTFYILFVPAIIVSTLSSALLSQRTFAFSNDDIRNALRAGWVSECTRGLFDGKKIKDDGRDVFYVPALDKAGDNLIIGHVAEPADGKLTCNAVTLEDVLPRIGYKDAPSYMTEMGCSKSGDSYTCPKKTQKEIYGKIRTDKKLADISDSAKYHIAAQTLVTACGIKPYTDSDQSSGKGWVEAAIPQDAGKETQLSKYTLEKNHAARISTFNTSINGGANGWDDDGIFTCGSLAGMTVKYAGAYDLDVKSGKITSPLDLGNMQKAAKAPSGTEGTDEAGEEEKTCGNTLSGIGWFVCATTEKFIDFVDGMWFLFEQLLIADPLDSPEMYDTWKNFRNIANALLVLVFIAIIYSQITNIGVSNYGIKKMLPKLVIAAVAINLSYILMQLTVDVANMLGKVIDNLLTDQVASVPYENAGWGFVWDGIIAAGGLAAAGVGMSAAFTVGGPASIMFVALLLVPAAIGIIAGLLALMFRSALIPILAILAPVAFVAWILPNTNKVFEKWKSTFGGLVFLYPLASIYYGGLKLTALIILGKSESNSFERLTALALLFMGTFVVLVLAIRSNSIMRGMIGSMSGAVNRLTGGIVGYAMGSAKGRMALNRERFKAGAEPDVSAGRLGRFGVRGIGNRISRAYQRSGQREYERQVATSIAKGDAEQRYQGAILDDQAGFAERTGVDVNSSTTGRGYMSSLTAKAIQNEEVNLKTADVDALANALESAIRSGNTIAAQAAQNRLLRSGSGGLEKFNEVIGANSVRDGLRSDLAANIKDNHAGVMDKDWGTRMWANAASDPNSSEYNMTMQQAQAKAHSTIANSGMSTEEFAGLSTKAQNRIIGDDAARSALSAGTLETLGDESSLLGSKISQDVRRELKNELAVRKAGGGSDINITVESAAQTAATPPSDAGDGSRGRNKPLEARARQRK